MSLLLTSCVTLGLSFNFSGLCFLFCKPGLQDLFSLYPLVLGEAVK